MIFLANYNKPTNDRYFDCMVLTLVINRQMNRRKLSRWTNENDCAMGDNLYTVAVLFTLDDIFGKIVQVRME